MLQAVILDVGKHVTIKFDVMSMAYNDRYAYVSFLYDR
jgi:hypothetical protein